jgi:hypothetical protein
MMGGGLEGGRELAGIFRPDLSSWKRSAGEEDENPGSLSVNR